jgi:hypothetical protein
VKFAYADPPYLGMCGRYDHEHGDGGCWDDIETHRLLIEQLGDYDGWALSMGAKDLGAMLPMTPEPYRVLSWVKTWASWKPGPFPVCAWEPVVIRGQRKRDRKREKALRLTTPVDWLACPAHQRGFFGSKPETFTHWVLRCLGVQPEDEFVDLFPGSGAVTKAYERWIAQQPLGLTA